MMSSPLFGPSVSMPGNALHLLPDGEQLRMNVIKSTDSGGKCLAVAVDMAAVSQILASEGGDFDQLPIEHRELFSLVVELPAPMLDDVRGKGGDLRGELCGRMPEIRVSFNDLFKKIIYIYQGYLFHGQ